MAASAFLIPNPTSTGGPYLLRSRGASSQQHGQGVPRLCRIWHLPSSSLARGSSSSFLIVFFSSSWSSGTSAARFLEAIDVPARDARPPAAAGGEDEDRGASRLSQQLARRSALGFQPAACMLPATSRHEPGHWIPIPAYRRAAAVPRGAPGGDETPAGVSVCSYSSTHRSVRLQLHCTTAGGTAPDVGMPTRARHKRRCPKRLAQTHT